MDKIELVQSLIDTLNELPHRDEEKLDALKRRAEMIIRKVFGDSSKYLGDLNRIHLHPNIGPASETFREKMWRSGQSHLLHLFNTILEELQLSETSQTIDKSKKADIKLSKRIFIVHGRDVEMKQTVARTLEKLGLDPVILHEKPSEGRTIIEKFTDYSDVSFAVVLLSPDDIGYPRNKSEKDGKPRARQNVIFELGFFIGKLGRKRVLTLYKEVQNFEMPSDYSGVLYTPYDEEERWRFDLVRELNACDYDVDANKLV